MTARLASTAEIAALLDRADGVRDLSRRMDRVSEGLLGHPYLADSLVGSTSTSELLVARLDGFDCVTFVESVLALALSRRAAHFAPLLQSIRYLGGRVRWRDRNHYFTQWVRRNTRLGFVVEREQGEVERGAPRRLDGVADLPPPTWKPRYLPVAAAHSLANKVKTGDIVAFVSTRADLDVFHVGLLVEGAEVRLRHAGKSNGQVVEEPLVAFLARNTTPGLLLLRPKEPPHLDTLRGGVA